MSRSRRAVSDLSFRSAIPTMVEPIRMVAQAVLSRVAVVDKGADGRIKSLIWSEPFLWHAWSVALLKWDYDPRRQGKKSGRLASERTYAAWRARSGVSTALRVFAGVYWMKGKGMVTRAGSDDAQLSAIDSARLHSSRHVRRDHILRDVVIDSPAPVDVDHLLACLTPFERWLLRSHYMEGRDLSDIALSLGRSRARVSQMIIAAKAKARLYASDDASSRRNL